MPSRPVLIIGAGPTGLALALWLSRLGVAVRIVDKNARAAPFSRALGVQARTLEFYWQLGLDYALLHNGVQIRAVNFWVKGVRAAHLDFGDVARGLTPYPFILDYAQNDHEQMLMDRLSLHDVYVERDTELTQLDQHDDHVDATLRLPDGSISTVETSYVAGCDGARSTVRQLLGIGFPGGTYSELFYVADVQASGPAIDGEFHIDLDRADLLAVFPMVGEAHVRLVGTVRDEAVTEDRELTFEDVSKRAMDSLGLDVSHVSWFSTYRVHHRVANSFGRGRVFLLGDAAHIHSPVGAQGMNTGIGDAVNLAWKLAAVLNDGARESLLDTYEAERIGFARELVGTTDRVFTLATKRNFLAAIIRTNVLPRVVPLLARYPRVRQFLFRTVSQIDIHYRASPLSLHSTGAIDGGDRLPWISLKEVRMHGDNFGSLSTLAWQVHVYGEPRDGLADECTELGLSLAVFPWTSAAALAGVVRNTAYLVRPDGYIAFGDRPEETDRLRSYFARHYKHRGAPTDGSAT